MPDLTLIANEAIPWSNVAFMAVIATGFVAFGWVVTRNGGSLLDIEFRDPAETKPPEWRYERTTKAGAPCSECGTDEAVCRHLVTSKGMAGCCGACGTGDTHVTKGPEK